MEQTTLKLVEKSVTTDILCNKCGGSCKDYIDAKHENFNFNYATITSDFGYGSVLYDMTSFEVHLCESCYAVFEATFAIPPQYKQHTLL